ncbi:hypothetical protein BFW01_g7646 [Lasiodiplodia theobromae]|uniref:Uncharacterized protein n=1 Tax=Lasiodiplodia theobromae TaxID=45133 RepID=A0A5N5CX21_9PEZI|nr:hypothetical protein DBV05_g11414 [Lasiodiplodia theobromae]KAF9636750.1 hypothetical protein BFW01_g7646 [Lasiodiplodia theobromae]
MDEYISPFNSPLCDNIVDVLSAIVSSFFALIAFFFATVTELTVGIVSLIIFIASTTVQTTLGFAMSLINAIITSAVRLIVAVFPPIVTLVQLLVTYVAYPVINWPDLAFISLGIAALSYAVISSSARGSIHSHIIQPFFLHIIHKLSLWKEGLVLTYETWQFERAEKAATKARVKAEAEAAAAAAHAQAQAQAAFEAAQALAQAEATAAFEAGQARARAQTAAVSAATTSLPSTPTIPRKTPTTLLLKTAPNGYYSLSPPRYTPLYPPHPRTPPTPTPKSSSNPNSTKRLSPNEKLLAHHADTERYEWHTKTGRYSDWARSYRPTSQRYPHVPAPVPSSPPITGLITTAPPPPRYHPHPLSILPPEQMHLLYGPEGADGQLAELRKCLHPWTTFPGEEVKNTDDVDPSFTMRFFNARVDDIAAFLQRERNWTWMSPKVHAAAVTMWREARIKMFLGGPLYNISPDVVAMWNNDVLTGTPLGWLGDLTFGFPLRDEVLRAVEQRWEFLYSQPAQQRFQNGSLISFASSAPAAVQSTMAPQPVVQNVPSTQLPLPAPAVIPVTAPQPAVQAVPNLGQHVVEPSTLFQPAVPIVSGGGGSSVLANAVAKLVTPSTPGTPIRSTTPATASSHGSSTLAKRRFGVVDAVQATPAMPGTPPVKSFTPSGSPGSGSPTGTFIPMVRKLSDASSPASFISTVHGEDDDWARQGPTKRTRA